MMDLRPTIQMFLSRSEPRVDLADLPMPNHPAAPRPGKRSQGATVSQSFTVPQPPPEFYSRRRVLCWDCCHGGPCPVTGRSICRRDARLRDPLAMCPAEPPKWRPAQSAVAPPVAAPVTPVSEVRK
jgi:hypothetical protein